MIYFQEYHPYNPYNPWEIKVRCDICSRRKAVVQEHAFAVCLRCQTMLIKRKKMLEREREQMEDKKSKEKNAI